MLALQERDELKHLSQSKDFPRERKRVMHSFLPYKVTLFVYHSKMIANGFQKRDNEVAGKMTNSRS